MTENCGQAPNPPQPPPPKATTFFYVAPYLPICCLPFIKRSLYSKLEVQYYHQGWRDKHTCGEVQMRYNRPPASYCTGTGSPIFIFFQILFWTQCLCCETFFVFGRGNGKEVKVYSDWLIVYPQGVHWILCFFLKMWFFWTLPVQLQRWFSIILVCVHTLTPRENRERPKPGIF